MLHVHPNLVGAPGFQFAAQQAQARGETLDHFIMRHRLLAHRVHTAFNPVVGVAGQRRINRAATIDLAINQGQVFTLDCARLQLAHQVGMCFQGFGHDQQTRRILVQPVHDARTRQFGHLRHPVQKRIQQGAVTVAATRMDHQADRLVDHHQHRILKHDIKRNGFRRVRGGVRVGFDFDPHRLAAADFHLGGAKGVIHGNFSGTDPVLDTVARELRQHGRQGLIQALAAVFIRDNQPADVAFWISLIITRRIFCVFSHA